MEKYTEYLESARCICRSIGLSAARIESCRPESLDGNGSQYSTSHSRHVKREGLESALSRRRCKTKAIKIAPQRSEDKCWGTGNEPHTIEPERKSISKATCVDIEKAARLLHVVLNVAGMNCSGCANNLTRAIRATAGTANIKVIFYQRYR